MKMIMKLKKSNRYSLIDLLRGISIILMIAYHTIWDLVNIYDIKIEWFNSQTASTLQMYIRCSFILISGFCWDMSRQKLRRSIIVISGALLISLATAVFVPENAIIHGVLSLIGVGMLVTIPLDKLFKRLPAILGIVICLVLFVITYDTELGYFCIGNLIEWKLPKVLYANTFTAFFGFQPNNFYSPDYVPFLPWIFLFWIGYFVYRIFERQDILKYLKISVIKPIEFLGRHSLSIYLLHQPIIYGILKLVFNFKGN